MTKPFAEVINGIRTAIYGREVREDIAQMGEYVERFAETTIQKATESKNSADAAKESEEASKQTLDDMRVVAQNAQKSADSATKSEQGAGEKAKAAAVSASAAEQSEKRAEEHANKAAAAANTDTTLTISGAPADAKTVGDALNARYTKTETYSKNEVDQKIEDVHIETDATLTVSGAAADAKVTGDRLTAVDGEVQYIKLKIATSVTKNPFEVSFETLDDVTAEGVWNYSSARIEF